MTTHRQRILRTSDDEPVTSGTFTDTNVTGLTSQHARTWKEVTKALLEAYNAGGEVAPLRPPHIAAYEVAIVALSRAEQERIV